MRASRAFSTRSASATASPIGTTVSCRHTRCRRLGASIFLLRSHPIIGGGQLRQPVGDRLVVDVEQLLRAGDAQARRFERHQHDAGDQEQQHRRAADQHLAVDARDRLRPGAQLERLGCAPWRPHRRDHSDRPSSWLRLPPDGIGAHDAHDALRRRAESQLGGGEQPIDDVGGAAHAVVDQRRLAVADRSRTAAAPRSAPGPTGTGCRPWRRHRTPGAASTVRRLRCDSGSATGRC